VQINGVNYHIERTGYGPTLLLLHGFTGSGQSWQPYLKDFTPYLHVVTIDLLGHGRSDAPVDSARYGMEYAARDVVEVIDRIDVKPVHLLGYSMGGRLALYIAIHYPDRVARLILESTSPGLRDSSERQQRCDADDRLAEFLETEGIVKFVNYWENIPLFASQKRLPLAVQAAQREQRLQNNPQGLAGSLRGMGTGRQPSLWDQLTSLDSPTQLIAGGLDTKFLVIAQQMHMHLPESRLTISSNAGHAVHLEDSGMFTTCVLDFLMSD